MPAWLWIAVGWCVVSFGVAWGFGRWCRYQRKLDERDELVRAHLADLAARDP